MPQGTPDVKGFDTVLVLDFGAQYGQLIARRVRECRVYSELIPYDTPIARIKAFAPKGIILSGGPMSVYVEDAPQVDPEVFKLGIGVIEVVGYCAQADGGAKLARLFKGIGCRDNLGEGLAGLGNENFVALADLLQQFGKLGFGFVDIVRASHTMKLAKAVD